MICKFISHMSLLSLLCLTTYNITYGSLNDREEIFVPASEDTPADQPTFLQKSWRVAKECTPLALVAACAAHIESNTFTQMSYQSWATASLFSLGCIFAASKIKSTYYDRLKYIPYQRCSKLWLVSPFIASSIASAYQPFFDHNLMTKFSLGALGLMSLGYFLEARKHDSVLDVLEYELRQAGVLHTKEHMRNAYNILTHISKRPWGTYFITNHTARINDSNKMLIQTNTNTDKCYCVEFSGLRELFSIPQ